MARSRMRDVVVVLPGITGSVLRKDGHDLWAISGQAAWRALRSLGGSLDELVLDGDDPQAPSLDDGVRAVGVMPDAHLVPGLVKVDGYAGLRRMVTDHFEVVAGEPQGGPPANFFEFAYDWRRDNRAAAWGLKRLVDVQLPRWRDFSGAEDARVVLLAHSMGGVVARYYLEVLGGWRQCRALVTFGTPFRGSVSALGYLANGFKKLFVDLTEVMRSFTSVYQLLPIYRMLHVDGEWQRVAETTGLDGVDGERARTALAFHREIEAAVAEHRDDPEYLREGYVTVPVVGCAQPTAQSARLAGERVEVDRDLPGWIASGLGAGDGTVPRLSATPVELSGAFRETFVAERHSSLQANRRVLQDLRERLTQMQARGHAAIRGPAVQPDGAEQAVFAVDVDDLYAPGEPVRVSVRAYNADVAGGVRARLERVDPPARALTAELVETSDAGWELDVDLDAGRWRVEVAAAHVGSGSPPPVHDIFEVAG